MTVKQFNAHWVPHEDRIYLRFNTLNNEEYRFWLTRNTLNELFVRSKEIIQGFFEQAHRPEVAELVEDFQKEKIKNKITTGGQFQKSNTLPLGDLPLLILKTSILEKKNYFSLSFQVVSKKKIDVPVNIKTLQSLIYLLEKTQEQGNWLLSTDISQNQKNNTTAVVTKKKIVH